LINTSKYKYWTKRDFKIILKKFYKWLRENEGQNYSKYEYPDEVKWINTGKKQNKKKLPQELLDLDDIKKLAENTNNLRDRGLILLLYESGGRIGEILNIKIKDLENDKYGSLITLSGKTGPRKIRIIASSPAINNWLLEHPNRNNKNAFIFCGIWGKKRGEEISYNTINKLLKETAEKAEINKPVNPHHFRHSRATKLAKNFTESQLCEYLGWIQGSKEAATYVHLSGRDMDKAVLSMHGIIDRDEEENNRFTTINCPRCKTRNPPGSSFCSNCSLGLDLKSVKSFEKTKDDFVTNLLNIIQDDELKLKTLDALTKVLHNS
jgi:integrase